MFELWRKIRVWLALRIVEKYVQRRTGVKAGIKTSEFWVAIVGSILAALAKAGKLPIDFPMEAILVLVGYILSRGIAKLRPATSDQ